MKPRNFHRKGSWWGAMLALLALSSCQLEGTMDMPVYQPYALELPEGFPEMPIPDDNPLIKSQVELGRMLFYEPLLSEDSSVSCASCHLQELAFTGGDKVSTGIHGRTGFRNAPALFNLAWHEDYMKDGGVPTLELQVLAPVEEPVEMGMNFRYLVERLRRDPEYTRLFSKAFGRLPDAFGITRAISAFERTLISGNSRYDQFVRGDANALSPAEQRGLALFKSDELACTQCHDGFDFRKDGFENNGLYLSYADSGRARVTLNPLDKGKFKVPSLRNVEMTAPYMHDGSLENLDAVIEHYASGGMPHPNKSEFIRGFILSPAEKQDLKAFLHSLTDESFLNDPRFAE